MYIVQQTSRRQTVFPFLLFDLGPLQSRLRFHPTQIRQTPDNVTTSHEPKSMATIEK